MVTTANPMPQAMPCKLGLILCRDHYPAPPVDARRLHPRFIETLAAAGLFPDTLFVVHRHAGEDLPAASRAAAWLISGEPDASGPQSPWNAGLVEFLRSAHFEGIPLYGIVGGERVLAAAFAGPASAISLPRAPNIRNPIVQFRPSDRLFRLVPATRSVTACPLPRAYRDLAGMRDAFASASSLIRMLAAAP